MTSKKQKESGYILPDPILGYDMICVSLQIPNVREYRAAFVGHLFKLANWWTWEKSYQAGDERAKEVASFWRRTILDTLRFLECDPGTPDPGGDTVGCKYNIGDVFINVNETAPAGALLCDGSTYLRTAYPELYAAIHPNYHIDADNFKVPNLSGKSPMGTGSVWETNHPQGSPTPINMGGDAGAGYVTLDQNTIPPHQHTQSDQYGTSPLKVRSSGANATQPFATNGGANDLYTGSYGEGYGHANIHPVHGVKFYIQAVNCDEEQEINLQMRLSSCLLEYSLDGVIWYIVDGWTAYRNCLNIPLPFDLRVNNCVMEYSRDSAQTWNPVPGWSSVGTCFESGITLDDMTFKFEDCILWYSRDGGEDWNPVFNWNEIYDCVQGEITSKDRCVNAWGSAWGLKELAHTFASLASTSADIGEFVEKVDAKWFEVFGDRENAPDELNNFINYVWDSPNRSELIIQIASNTNAELLADYIYSLVPSGEWCSDEIVSFNTYMDCAEASPVEWITAIMYFMQGYFWTDVEHPNKRKARARLMEMKAEGVCQDCEALGTYEPCSAWCHWFDPVAPPYFDITQDIGYYGSLGHYSSLVGDDVTNHCRLDTPVMTLTVDWTVKVDAGWLNSPNAIFRCHNGGTPEEIYYVQGGQDTHYEFTVPTGSYLGGGLWFELDSVNSLTGSSTLKGVRIEGGGDPIWTDPLPDAPDC